MFLWFSFVSRKVIHTYTEREKCKIDLALISVASVSFSETIYKMTAIWNFL